MSSGALHGRIALVTGASRGIGRALALALAQDGAHVIAAGRNSKQLEGLDDAIRAAGGEAATLTPFNLRDFNAIDRLGQAVFDRWGRLDILASAGALLGQLGPIGHVRPDAWNEIVEVNLTSQWRLIRAFDPLLRLSDAGRAVFFTTGAAQRIRAYWGPYSVTKAGLEALVRSYAAELADSPVRANLFNPGPTRTAMRAKAMPGEDAALLQSPEDAAAAAMMLCRAACQTQGARYVLRGGALIQDSGSPFP